jgi:hypothetical protein
VGRSRSGQSLMSAELPRLEKRLRNGRAYYTIYWSPLKKAEKFAIAREVPSMAGFFELYFRDHDGSLKMFYYAKIWLGGLRSAIRHWTDPTLVLDNDIHKQFIKKHECYYRYFMCPNKEDMDDIVYFFSRTDRIDKPEASSGRYREILLKELQC